MITLYQFPRMLGVPNASPFCMKLETFLRMAELKYEISEMPDPRKAPKGKLPFIKDGDTEVPDSRLVIDYLVAHYDIGLDKHLSAPEKAVARAFAIMMEEHYYWVLLMDRWTGDNWPKVRERFFAALPPVVRSFVPAMIQKQVKADLHSQGIGRHDAQTAYELANQDMKSVADFLGDKRFFMGDKPTTADATLFGVLANVVNTRLSSPLRDFVIKHDNLMAYTKRMGEMYFPEFEADFG